MKAFGAFRPLSALRSPLRQVVAEAVETFRLNLSNPSGGATLAKSFGTATIQQNPILPAFTTNRTSVSNTGVAPFVVHLDASATTAVGLTSMPFHELYYSWDFGDSGNTATWGRGLKAGVALKNEANGPIAAALFEKAGTFAITLRAYHLASNWTLTIADPISTTITVANPDTVFSGANTICVANGTLPVAGVNGVPSGATCYNQSNWATVVGYMQTGKRVLLKRGDAWTTASAVGVSQAGPGIIGAYGTGAKPLVTIGANQQPLNFSTDKHDWRVVDLEITGAETGTSYPENDLKNGVNVYQADYITLLRCNFHNLYLTGLVQESGHFSAFDSVFDTSFTSYGNMVFFASQSPNLALVGNKFNNSPLTHVLRVSGTNYACVNHNDISNPGPTRQAFTIRGWEASTPFTEYVVVGDNNISGGSSVGSCVYFGYVNVGTNEELRDIIFERNLVNGTTYDVALTSRVAQRFTCRSNVFTTESTFAIELSGGNAAGAPPTSSAYIYNNTIFKPSASQSSFFSAVLVGSGASGIVIKNNLAYAPSMTKNGGQLGTGATFLYLGGTATSGDYTESNNTSDVQINATRPWSAVSPVAPSDYTPNGYGVNAGAHVPVCSDILASTSVPNISGTREIGAIQV